MSWNDPDLQVSALELQTSGILMEINRQVLHPLGMAMWADDDGNVGIARSEEEDPTGIVFAGFPADVVAERVAAWQELATAPGIVDRHRRYGWIVQPYDTFTSTHEEP